MKHPRIVAALLASAVASLAPGAALDGTWCINAAKPSGVIVKTLVTLHGDGGKLTGSVLANSVNDLPIRDAHMEGADEVFRVDWLPTSSVSRRRAAPMSELVLPSCLPTWSSPSARRMLLDRAIRRPKVTACA